MIVDQEIEKTENNEIQEQVPQDNMKQIVERLNYEYISYLHIQDNINFPLLLKGDIVALRKNDHYKVMDIILYQVKEYYFIRRIIAIDDNKYYVCGDHEYEVRIIHPNMIIARAISRERGKKRLSLILMNKKRIYSKTILRKGRLRMKKHLIYDDESTLTNLYDQLKNTAKAVEEKVEKPQMQLDARLAAMLVGFKSPDERLKEFQTDQKKTKEK